MWAEGVDRVGQVIHASLKVRYLFKPVFVFNAKEIFSEFIKLKKQKKSLNITSHGKMIHHAFNG